MKNDNQFFWRYKRTQISLACSSNILEYNPPPSSMDLLYGSSLHARHHRRGGMPIIQPIHNCQRHAPLQGSSKDKTPGSNNFVPSLACHFYLAWPADSFHPGAISFGNPVLISMSCNLPPSPGVESQSATGQERIDDRRGAARTRTCPWGRAAQRARKKA